MPLSPLSILRRKALRRGLVGGSTGWMVVGVLVYAPRVARRLFGRPERVVATERLKPGEFVRIDAVRPPTRAERRAAKRGGTAR
jgi:hypothetical protein